MLNVLNVNEYNIINNYNAILYFYSYSVRIITTN